MNDGEPGFRPVTRASLGLAVANAVTFLGLTIAGGTSQTPVSISSTVNNYAELNIQNLSAGISASSDLVVTADTGTASTKFGDFGINSSGWTGTAWGGPLDVYLYANDNDLWIGTAAAGKVVRINAAGGLASNTVLTVASTGITAAKQMTFNAGALNPATGDNANVMLSGNYGGGVTWTDSTKSWTVFADGFGAQWRVSSGASSAARNTRLVCLDTGEFGVGVIPTAGNGLIQTATGTTKANGWGLSTDLFLFRGASGELHLTDGTGSAVGKLSPASGLSKFFINTSASVSLVLQSAGTDRIVISPTGQLHLFGGTPVTRSTYGAPTGGAADRTTFDTTTITLPQLAQRVRALIDDLRARGDFA